MEKTEIVNPNISVGGFSSFSPLIEEYILYKTFFGKSIWNTTKKSYWDHEKAILLWAYSQRHKHLGNPIDSGRIKEMYGFSEISKENISADKNCELVDYKDWQKLVEDMKESKGDLIDPLLGNLVQKGLAYVLKRYENDQEKETPYVAAIMISREGLIVGKLVHKEQNRKMLPYKMISAFITLISFIVISLVIFEFIDKLYPIANMLLDRFI